MKAHFEIFLCCAVLFRTVTTFLSEDFVEGIDIWLERIIQAMVNTDSSPPFKVHLQIHTREEREMKSLELPAGADDLGFLKQNLSQKKKFIFIIPGYLAKSTDQWCQGIFDSYLQREDVAIFVVDWSSGSITWFYFDATEKAELAAAHLKEFIEFVRSNGMNNSIHLIGHSIGAHIAGLVGRHIPHIDRITALDPALPNYLNGSKKLKIGDAKYVDVVHTDTLFGYRDQFGDVDFYINGGKMQPECGNRDGKHSSGVLEAMKFVLYSPAWFLKHMCAHRAATAYFIESLNKTDCNFVACKTKERAEMVRSEDFDPKQDTVLGFDTFKYNCRGKVYIATNQNPPYCRK